MKKVYLSLFGLVACCAMSAQVDVTFNVDMTNETVSGNGVHAAGNFYDNNYDGTADNAAYMSASTADGNWDPGVAALELTDGDADNIYSMTLSLMPGRYEFKFINGNIWDNAESVPNACTVEVNGNSNREIMVGASAMTYAVCYAKCVACGENAVRFRVDMSTVDLDGDGTYAEPGEDISPDGVHVAGDFQGWNTAANVLTDINGDNVYETTLSVGTASSIIFKFINGNDWIFPNEQISGACGNTDGNRVEAVGTDNVVLPQYCWSSCDPCTQPVAVTFSVNMNTACINTDAGVNLMGTATDWSGGTPMLDLDLDGIWELTLNLAPGSYEYKFRVGTDGWEGFGGNRTITVAADTPQTLPAVCFGSADPCGTTVAPSTVTFQATAGSETVPAGQKIWIMGDFTSPSWQGGAIALDDTDADGTWSVTVPNICPINLKFKYVIGLDNLNTGTDWLEETGNFSEIGGCGVDNGDFSDNREYVRTSTDAVTICYAFNTCEACIIGVDEMSVVTGLSVFPVPAEDYLNVNFTSPNAQRISMKLINSLGQVSLEENLGTVSGQRVVRLNTSDLATGIYTLAFSNGSAMQTQLISVK